tara:strand:+ start:461 stop:1594 length:1134 start_codon:yes stop_codon:yes gene_type:complete
MATFRTDPNTGRTVISEANRVDRPISDFSSSDAARTSNRLEGDPRSGGFGPPVLQDPGTGYMTRQEFETVSGMTDTNPYGNDGFFSRVFGIDPNKIDYTNNLGPRGIENVKRQAYDRFMNPFARVDAFGRPTMGADPVAGTTRSGVQPGDLTVFGPAVQSQREGIAGLFENTMLGSLMPKQARIPGYDTGILVPELGLGGPQPGEGVDPAQRFGAQSAVDYSNMGDELLGVNAPRVDERLTPMSFPGNVDDLGNELGAFPEPEDRFAFEDRKGQRQAAARPPQTVAEILMQEPPVASITVDRPRVTDRPPVTLPSQKESAPSVVFPEQSSELPIDMLELLGIRQPGDPLPDLVPSGGTSLPAPVYIIPQGGFADPRK